MMNVRVLFLTMGAVALTACSEKDLYDEGAYEQQQKATYAENFAKKYPNVSLNRSWDFSTKQSYFTFGQELGSKAATRAGEGGYVKGGWYEVDGETLAWMQNRLVERNDNSSLGKAFYMTVPNNDFTVVPIFQGIAGAVWDFHVVVDGVDYKIWSKSEDIEVKDDGTVSKGEWYPVKGIKTYEWGAEGDWWDALENTIGDRYDIFYVDEAGEADVEANKARVKVNVTSTRAKEIKFSGLPVGAEMYFYLEVTKSGNDENNQYQNVGDRLSSVDHQMLAFTDVPRPKNIPAENEVMVVGCEDANLENSDWDYNDVVFLVYGEKIPKPIEIIEGTVVKEVSTVRYMVEDLGSTDDFDFNDIVIDVSEIKEKTPIYVNGKQTDWKYGDTCQEATIRHLGGTLPFILRIGDTQLEEREGQMGANPNEKFSVTGWKAEENNISVTVLQKDNDGVQSVNIPFPKAGEVPMIIAVDPSQTWMPERQSIPESWFTVPAE